MSWLGWLVVVGGLVGLVALWDWVFCRGRYCRWFMDQL